jgi:hypothetical protein
MKYKPLPGRAFVRLESQLLASYDGLVLPEAVKKRPGKSGIVIAWEPYPDASFRAFLRGRLVTRNWSCFNKQFEGMIGKRVVCDAGQIMQIKEGNDNKQIYIVRLEHIILILDRSIEVEQRDIHFNGVPRCRWCKSAGEDNMILDNLGYCPACNLNTEGHHRRFRTPPPVSDELSYTMNKHIVDGIEHSKLSKKIMSFGEKDACRKARKGAK